MQSLRFVIHGAYSLLLNTRELRKSMTVVLSLSLRRIALHKKYGAKREFTFANCAGHMPWASIVAVRRLQERYVAP